MNAKLYKPKAPASSRAPASRSSLGVEPNYADPDEVAFFAAGLKQQYLLCRTYGHHFNPYTVRRTTTAGRKSAYYEQTLRCKCRVRRILVLDRTCNVVSSRHDYSDAPGYLSEGIGRIVGEGRSALRREAITRLIMKEEEDS